MKMDRRWKLALASAVVATGLSGCAFSGGIASPTQVENNATAQIPGNTSSLTPYAADATILAGYLPTTIGKVLQPGAAFIDAVYLRNLPNAIDFFLEDTHARIISKLTLYGKFTDVTRAELGGFAKNPGDLKTFVTFQNNKAYASLIDNILGMKVETVPVSALPSALRPGFVSVKSVQVLSFATIAVHVHLAANFLPISATNIILSPTTGLPDGSYSSPLPVPKGLNP